MATRTTPQGGGKGGAVRKVPRTGSYGPLSKWVISMDSKARTQSQVGATGDMKVEGSLDLHEAKEFSSIVQQWERQGKP